ncbi:MAG: hypothetical protein H6731_03220 [Myxococcales bacterium]|nr:MAG: hypothetical protein H6731_03220 [Myxococcales bacterium]
MLHKILLLVLFSSLFSCSEGSNDPNSINLQRPAKTSINFGQKNYSMSEAEWDKFMNLPFLYYALVAIPTVNFLPTDYAMSAVPQATVFGDYHAKKFSCTMAVKFSSIFEKNLPIDLQAELRKRGLLNSKSVDIAWVIQPLENLGGNSDQSNKHLTYLKGHGWADPESKGTKVGSWEIDRKFLYGLFDMDVDIS